MSNGEMIIGIEYNKPPMTYYDNSSDLTGFDIEFAEAICSKLGVDIIFKEISWDMKETELETKNVDCVWSAFTITETRLQSFEFTRPYLHNKQVVVIRRSDVSKFTDTKSLSGAKMSAAVATTGEEALLGDPYLSQSDYTESSTQKDALDILKKGLCDAIVIDYTFAKFYITNDESELMVIENINLQEEQYGVGFRHGSDMTQKINNLFLNMILDGSLTTLSEKYNIYDLYSPIILTDYDYIMNKGKMIVGFQENLPPMNYYDQNGQLVGIDVDFAKAVCEELGIDIEFKVIVWDDKEIDLKNRRIDCIWSALTVTDERREIMKFSRVYMSNTQVIMIRKSDAAKFTTLEDFVDSTMSSAVGSVGENVIKNDQYLSKANFINSSSSDESIVILNNGDVDAIVIDYTIALGSIANGFPNLMIVEGINFGEEVYAVGFRYGSDMTIRLNEIINSMISDGRLESLANKYNLADLYNAAVKDDGKSDMNYIMSKGELVVGIEDNSSIMSYYNDNGKLIGFDIEFATTVCSRLGIYVIFKNIDWDKKETELNDRNIDCLWNSLTVTEENHDNFEFSIGYLINRQVVVIRKSDESKYINLESLSGVKMSAGHSTIGEELFNTDPYLSKAKYTASSSQNEAIVALKNKIVDAIVIDYTLAQGYIKRSNSDLMIVEGISLKEEPYRIGFRAGSDMAKKINNVILDMIIDDTLSTIAKTYDLIDFYTPLKITDADYIIRNGKMIIAYDGEFPPMNYYDNNGKMIGFDVELANAICNGLGIEVEFKLINWDEKEYELKNRNVDCILNGLTISDERRSVMKFSRVYMKYRPVIIIRKSDVLIYHDIESLSTGKISAEHDTPEENSIKDNVYLSKAEYIPSSTQINAIIGLRNKDFDAVIIDSTSAIGYINNGYSDLMIFSEIEDEEEKSYGIGFRLKSNMTVRVNELINEMINDGTLELIAKKYGLLDHYKSAIKKNEDSELDDIMSEGELIIGINVSGAPMSYYNEYDELTGFDTEFAKLVCSKLGIDAVFKIIEWSKKEEELNNKNIDCVWNAFTVTPERRNYFEFTNPYLSNRQAVVIRISDASKFNDKKSLSEVKLTAVLGTSSEQVVKEELNISEEKYTSSSTYEEAISGLKNKNFDALIIDFSVAKGVVAINSDLMIADKIILHEEQYAIGFRINSDITEKVNSIMLDMILDNTLDTLAEKYDLVDLFEPVKITDASYIMNNGKMIIGFDGTLAPMAYYDDNHQLTGFDIDFAKVVCKELGISAEFKPIEWTEKEGDLKNRDIDCIWSGLSVTEKRREIMKFSRVYMNNRQAVVIRKSNIIRFYTLESLSEKRLTTKTGTLGESAIKTFLPNAIFKGFYSLDDAFIALQKGEADALVIDYTMAKDKINNGFSDLMILESIKLMDDQYAIGFRHGSDMSKKVNEVIKQMISDGRLNEIAEKYDLLNLYMNKKKVSNVTIIAFILMILYTLLLLLL
ncbi:periplasmic binding protein-like II [Neocallimastix lanati (nom. inval.)]|jgi:ABC-type amino acid transport substrate-binding protein|uniref:Periplasmic binding protein-like II n=1 Tax=Neocallimastix californiae TaxID=1754190 RepID=A0A1Y2AF47_9FUNG|nr:periplasmic binding protein-like II [Neocallimastix sp. JGI-2020a]ORY20585.1 periplasmic binding protein-like II [Neocallimastix californiae]|eukprot:ORY20585.1 periplasmic binding protein-like II [Neocallimastix californiae]